jgi:predicted MFS family arabinose efflux permease
VTKRDGALHLAGFWAAILAIQALWGVAGIHRFLASVLLGASTILDDFGITATAAGLLAGIYFPVYGVVQIPSGILADYRSPKRIILVSSLFLFLSSVAFALAPTFELAVIARGIVGFASGFIWLPALKLFLLTGHDRYSRLIGALAVAGNVGGMVALLGLPALLQVWSWRWVTVLTAVPALALALALLLTPVPEAPRGGGLWQPLASGLRAAVTFLGNLRFWPIFLVAIMWNGAHFGLVTWLPRYARDVLGQDRATVGLLAALVPLGLVLAGYAAGWLYQRLGPRGSTLYYSAGVVYTGLLVAFAASGQMAVPLALVFVIVLGLGMFFSGFYLSLSLLVHIVPSERLGAASGLLNGAAFGPAFATPWLMGFILDLVDRPVTIPWTYSAQAFTGALSLPAALMASALLAALVLRRRAQAIAGQSAPR